MRRSEFRRIFVSPISPRKIARAMALAPLAALAATTAATTPALAQSPEEFYRGRQITLFVGSGPGGGFDTYARVLARHMPGHIPGGPRAIVKNMPGGGGGLNLANYLYNVAPKDGSEFGMFTASVLFIPLFELEGARFEAAKFGMIGAMNSETKVCVVWHEAPATTFADAFDTPVRIGTTGLFTDIHQLPLFLKDVLGVKFNLVKGYPGTGDIKLAMERREVDGLCASWSFFETQASDWLRDKKAIPLVQLSDKSRADLQGVPLAIDYARDEKRRAVLELSFAPSDIERQWSAPPGLPPERLAALRAAFDATLRDAEFLAEAKSRNLEIGPISGAEAEAVLRRAYNAPPEVIEWARQIRKSAGGD